MKKCLTILGAITLVFFIGIITLISVVAVKGRGLDAESRRYADQTIIDIVSGWNKQALLTQATPDFTRACSAACTDALFNQADKLGAMNRYLGSKGQANMNFVLGTGMKITATYVARAVFAHGSASIQVGYRETRWGVAHLRIFRASGDHSIARQSVISGEITRRTLSHSFPVALTDYQYNMKDIMF